jgi:iron complex transport system ATP-binding protein
VRPPLLEARDVRAGYGPEDVIRGVSFELAAGELLGVAGPNGGGKSTLLRALTGLLPLRGGRVAIGGRPLGKLAPHERARLCAAQPQIEAPLFDYTTRDFVMLGRHPRRPLFGGATPADRDAVDLALGQTDLLALAGRGLRSLSTGEWQRALLARTLAQDAPLILLDEPAAHLDPGHCHAVYALLRSLAREHHRAILCVSHDLNLSAAFCDRLMLLAAGRVRAIGAPEEVLREEILHDVFGCPALRVADNPFTGRPAALFSS